MAKLSGLHRYPVKSCLGLDESRLHVGLEGLEGDRRYMVVRPDGTFITARTHPQLQQVRVFWLEDGIRLCAPLMGELELRPADFVAEAVTTGVWSDQFDARATHPEADAWFSQLLNEPARLLWLGVTSLRYRETLRQHVSFADGYPLLLMSQTSLDDLNQRAPTPQLMSQFRPNLVVSDTAAFAEDSWRRIRIGEVEFLIAKPCSRCVMTTLDAAAGRYHPQREPLATLATYRMGDDGEIYFGQNLVALNEGWVSLQDEVVVLEWQSPPDYAIRPRMPTEQVAAPVRPQVVETFVPEVGPLPKSFAVQVNRESGEDSFTADRDRPLLIQAEEAGVALPHACRAGICGRCKQLLVSGDVEQPQVPGLSPSQREDGLILTCCAKARSDLILAPPPPPLTFR
jgi:uncharacterized protein